MAVSEKARIDQEFASHLIKEHIQSACGRVGSYLVGAPGTSAMSFRVTYAPDIVSFSGDCGDISFERKTIAWLASAVRSPGYLLEKVPEGFTTREFSTSRALEWLAEEEAALARNEDGLDDGEIKHRRAALRDGAEVLDAEDSYPRSMTEHLFLEATSDVWEGNDPPSLREPTTRTEIMIGAVRCFVRLLEASPDGQS